MHAKEAVILEEADQQNSRQHQIRGLGREHL